MMVLEYLENTAINYPNNGIRIVDEFVSYNNFIIDSKKIASFLMKIFSVKSGVPIFMKKGIDTLKTMVASNYAGCFYSILNLELPKERLNMIASCLEAKYIICNKETYDLALEYFDGYSLIIYEDIINTAIDINGLSLIRNSMNDLYPLYCNFTSGSTGVPKGVLVGNRSVIDFIDNYVEIFNITNEDIIANQAPFDFDVSVKDIYSAFKTGANLVLIPKDYFSNPKVLIDYLCDTKATVLTWAVSALAMLSAFHALDYKTPSTIKKILFSGERMPYKALMDWKSHLPNTMFVNLYGPTEITCNCTYHILDNNADYSKAMPIGIPFPNEKVFLLNDGKIVEDDDIAGEICVAGDCLALGYLNNKEETNKRFVINPFNKNEMIYKTGDLAYYKNKLLYFSGRVDFQIKYMGHRIELEEIENSINKIDSVQRSICVFDEEKNKLFCFYIGNIDKINLHKTLKDKLPIYMIPNKIIKIDSFPLNKNGKVDRKELINLYGGVKRA